MTKQIMNTMKSGSKPFDCGHCLWHLSSAILGSFLAFAQGTFRWHILILATLTTLFLQILSNLANDYGDAMHGTDNENRIGPQRITQSGLVTRKQMRE